MNDGYIKEKEWFKCDINEVTYDCYLEYYRSIHANGPWVNVTVIKYTQKKLWFFKWKVEEFNCDSKLDIKLEQYKLINSNFYFKSEYVKVWVEVAIRSREYNIIRNKSLIEEEKNLKVLKKI